MMLIMALVAATIGLLEVTAQGKAASGHDDRSTGNMIFARHCAGCHGPEGKGDGYRMLGPDPAHLTRPSTRKKSDAALLQTIHEGKPNMPSWKLRLSEEESQAVLAYIRTLAK